MIKVGSDFSGVGAFEEALKNIGIKYEIQFSCDMDKFARETYLLNNETSHYFPENVYNRNIPEESLDIYMTSPPCQAFSSAGKNKGESDERGILFYNSYEFIKVNKPKSFVFENVQGLLSDDNGLTFNKWCYYLGGESVNGNINLFKDDLQLDYHIYYRVLNSKYFDIPQNRKRIFIVGIRKDLIHNFQFPEGKKTRKRIKDILENDVEHKYYLSQKTLDMFLKKNEKHTWEGKGFLFFPKKENQIANTITTKAGGRATDNFILTKKEPKNKVDNFNYAKYDNLYLRKLTPRECFRLMGFSDKFIINKSDSQAFKQAGNSIVVNVLESILKKIIPIITE